MKLTHITLLIAMKKSNQGLENTKCAAKSHSIVIQMLIYDHRNVFDMFK